MTEAAGKLLVLGIGNILMGDEGVGVHLVRRLEKEAIPDGVELLDGGTGSFNLLDPMQLARKVILIDATLDENSPGTVRRLVPRFSTDYPRTLAAHDIGLKDLLDTFYLLGQKVDVVLFAVSIAPLQDMGLELSPELALRIAGIAELVKDEIRNTAQSPALQAF